MKLFALILYGSIVTHFAGTKKYTDIEFAQVDKQSLKLDLYIPEGLEKPPLVVWVHGGV